jgi:hypothetical protein
VFDDGLLRPTERTVAEDFLKNEVDRQNDIAINLVANHAYKTWATGLFGLYFQPLAAAWIGATLWLAKERVQGAIVREMCPPGFSPGRGV